jgi:iron complex transport system substrate-binding protein
VRIVSLLPAATEIVCGLGLRSSLVGCSHECDYPESVRGLPQLTRPKIDSRRSSREIDEAVRETAASGAPLYLLDEEGILALAPDLVLTQETCEVCAISKEDVVSCLRRRGLPAQVLSFSPPRLADVFSGIEEIGRACGRPGDGRSFADALRARLPFPEGRPGGPRVAILEWLDPPFLAGHWAPDLVSAAGGHPVGLAPGEASRASTWDGFRGLDAEVLLVSPCGFDLARTEAESRPLLPRLLGLAPRILFMDGNAYLSRPGPRLVEAAELLAAFLAGEPLREGAGVAPFPA